jgi:hypothetical protein
MKHERNCPVCNTALMYSNIGNYKRAIKNNTICRKCSNSIKGKDLSFREKVSTGRKKYFESLSEEEHSLQKAKMSESIKRKYESRSDAWKDEWKRTCGAIAKERWASAEYKEKMAKILSENNWSRSENAKAIKKKQVITRIKNNGKYLVKGRCKEYTVNDIKCYGKYEKMYIEHLISENMILPKNVEYSIDTEYGTYTPDFEFEDFYVEVKSIFTYDVLLGKNSYSTNKYNPEIQPQLYKMQYISKNIKPVKIALVEKGKITYIEV